MNVNFLLLPVLILLQGGAGFARQDSAPQFAFIPEVSLSSSAPPDSIAEVTVSDDHETITLETAPTHYHVVVSFSDGGAALLFTKLLRSAHSYQVVFSPDTHLRNGEVQVGSEKLSIVKTDYRGEPLPGARRLLLRDLDRYETVDACARALTI